MKNLFLTLAFVCLVSLGAAAQATRVVSGSVLDSKGNPLSGALVEATGGAESTTTGSDGKFTLEVPKWLVSLTANYHGMKTQKKKLNRGDVVFRLSPVDGNNWFINLEGSVALGEQDNGRVGLMAGYLGNWGGYAKVLPTIMNSCYGIPAATVGVTKHVVSNMYSYLGAGYAPVEKDNLYNYENGGMFEIGFIFRLPSNVSFNVGYSYSTSFSDFDCHDIHIGIGTCF